MKDKGILIVVSGFSGSGKGTLMKKMLETYDNYALSISMTTRSPREGERDGVEYFFTDKQDFEQKISENQLIEYACYCENYYGTPKEYVEKKLAEGKDVILEIEIQGALKVKAQYPDCLLLFITPPSAKELERRLVGRGTESPEVIAKRLARAVEESEGIEAYDYIVINDDLETCVKQLHSIVQNAHNAAGRCTDFIREIREELKMFQGGEK